MQKGSDISDLLTEIPDVSGIIQKDEVMYNFCHTTKTGVYRLDVKI